MSFYQSDEEVFLLVRAFEERTLPKTEWTHAAHLTVGLYYCLHAPFGVAKNLIRDGIYWLNDAHGTPNTESSGYHETLTVFWMRAVDEFSRSVHGSPMHGKANRLIEKFDKDYPLRFYSRVFLFSDDARRRYVEPDLDGDRPGTIDQK